MTLKQFIYLLPRLVKYNLKIIFAGRFIWFLLAAFLFFAYFMFQIAWSRSEVNEGVVYNLLMFPCVLLVFYPAVLVSRTMRIAGYWKSFSASPTINIRYGVSVYWWSTWRSSWSWSSFPGWLRSCFILSTFLRCRLSWCSRSFFREPRLHVFHHYPQW